MSDTSFPEASVSVLDSEATYRRAAMGAAAIMASVREAAKKTIEPVGAVILEDLLVLFDIVFKHRALRDAHGFPYAYYSLNASGIFYKFVANKDWSMAGVKTQLWNVLMHCTIWEEFFETYDVTLHDFGVADRNTAIHAILRLASYCGEFYHDCCPLPAGPREKWKTVLEKCV